MKTRVRSQDTALERLPSAFPAADTARFARPHMNAGVACLRLDRIAAMRLDRSAARMSCRAFRAGPGGTHSVSCAVEYSRAWSGRVRLETDCGCRHSLRLGRG